jgi:hypothetical protein
MFTAIQVGEDRLDMADTSYSLRTWLGKEVVFHLTVDRVEHSREASTSDVCTPSRVHSRAAGRRGATDHCRANLADWDTHLHVHVLVRQS